MKKTRKPRETQAQQRERFARQSKYDYDQGLQAGLRQAQAKQAEDQKLKLIEANLKLAQHLGQMIEATARAVVTFLGEGGIRG